MSKHGSSILVTEYDRVRPTLLLDLDGTLVDSVPDLLASVNRMMAASGLAPFTAPNSPAWSATAWRRWWPRRWPLGAAKPVRAMSRRSWPTTPPMPPRPSRPSPDVAEHARPCCEATAGDWPSAPTSPRQQRASSWTRWASLALLDAVGAGDSFARRASPTPPICWPPGAQRAARGGERSWWATTDNDVLAAAWRRPALHLRRSGATVRRRWARGAAAIAERFADSRRSPPGCWLPAIDQVHRRVPKPARMEADADGMICSPGAMAANQALPRCGRCSRSRSSSSMKPAS